MSHNQRCYRKKIDDKTAKSSKKIDVLFKQAALSRVESGSPIDDVDDNENERGPEPCTPKPIETVTMDVVDNSDDDEARHDDESDSDNMEETSTPVPDARKFTSAKYETQYHWLYYNIVKMGYCCKLCEIFCPALLHNNVPNPFAVGILSLGSHPTRRLIRHVNSKTHIEAVEKKNWAATRQSHSGKAKGVHAMLVQHQDTVVNRNLEYMRSLIKTAFFVVKKHWALDSVSDVMDHMTEAGHDESLINYTAQNPHRKYTSSKSVSEIISIMNGVLEEGILRKLRNAEAYVLLADESSDEAHREQFALIVRFTINNSIVENFLGIVEVQRTDALSLMTAIQTFLQSKDVDIKKAVFVGFDGCNVMSGENKGLQRRFRHIVPHQLYINCRNHKLALCVKHLIKDYPIVDRVDTLLLAIWKLFHYSPRKFATLQEVQATYGIPKLRMLRASTTRWLSHGKACIRLVERYIQILDALDACLDEKYEPEVFGIREQLLDHNTIAGVLILCDILTPVIHFSDYLQGQVVFSDVMSRCQMLTDELHQLVVRFQATIADQPPAEPDAGLYLNRLQEFFTEINDRTNLARRLRQHNVFTPHQVVLEVAVPITIGLINEITDAFHCAPVLEAFKIFRLDNVPAAMNEMAVYGENEITTLARHYGTLKEDIFQGHRVVAEPRYSEADIKSQWRLFRPQLSIIKQRNENEDEGDQVQKLFEDVAYRNSFPAICYLHQLYQLIPTSTACVERIFSLMNLLCTPHRNRLGQVTLDSIMRICMHITLTEQEVQSIIDIFDTRAERHIRLH